MAQEDIRFISMDANPTEIWYLSPQSQFENNSRDTVPLMPCYDAYERISLYIF